MSSLGQPLQLAPGARVFVRGAEWVIRRVDQCSGEGMQVTCDGISELVRGQEGVFLTSLDADITLLDPAKTALVPDISSGFVQGRLFIESQLREAVPNDRSLWAGHRAAMDPAAYQLEPARQALCQPRQRILIADAVGLGKTLEAGILVSELIARGRGRRILVLAIKSMLTQFQKEFWNRFTIPLTRLDSDGLRRVRSRIPTNHNPFYYYDKSIISIDTLKRSSEYRTYLEDAYWDIIVIDEAHNVADRGTGSQRAQLARLLAKRSDTLVMLSATPHDGKARSFASLMNMLDPTAIADPDSYAKEDFSGKGLVVRRFKKDIRSEVSEVFKDRRVYSIEATATPAEEAAFEALLRVKVSQKRSGSGKRELFQVGLEKALFSSHEACLETVKQRIGKQRKALEKEASKGIEEEVESLEKLKVALGRIDRESSSRYQRLLRAIRGEPLEWKPRDPDDRVVIFTERIATMKWLGEGLQKDLRLSEGQLGTLDGSMSDIDQQRVVEEFGNRESKLRMLVCSDVASEGINLHYRCHRLIHYDMPWSLLVFQQRNGRIDRYGQDRTPRIVYLETRTRNETIQGDLRILEILKQKDQKAYEHIGDPSVFVNVHTIEEQEVVTGEAIAEGEDASAFDERLSPRVTEGEDLLAAFLGSGAVGGTVPETKEHGEPVVSAAAEPREPMSLFSSDLEYCERALHFLRETEPGLEFRTDRNAGSLELDAPADLQYRFRHFPAETVPDDWRFRLSADRQAMRRAMEESRKSERSWPELQYLWRLSPVVAWLNDRLAASFARHEAPVLAGLPGLGPEDVVFGFQGLIPNLKGHPAVLERGAAVFEGGTYVDCVTLESVIKRTGLDSGEVPNRSREVSQGDLRRLVKPAVEAAQLWVRDRRDEYTARIRPDLDRATEELEALRQRQLQHALRAYEGSRQIEAVKSRSLEERRKEIREIFDLHKEWVSETMQLDRQPWIKLLCVLTGDG